MDFPATPHQGQDVHRGVPGASGDGAPRDGSHPVLCSVLTPAADIQEGGEQWYSRV